MGVPVVVFARCRECDRRVRLVLDATDGCVPVEYADGSVRMTPIKDAIPCLVWCVGTTVVYARRGGVFADGSRSQRVPHGPMRGKPIKSRFVDRPCDRRCTHATGDTCLCSCGGLNHGADAA